MELSKCGPKWRYSLPSLPDPLPSLRQLLTNSRTHHRRFKQIIRKYSNGLSMEVGTAKLGNRGPAFFIFQRCNCFKSSYIPLNRSAMPSAQLRPAILPVHTFKYNYGSQLQQRTRRILTLGCTFDVANHRDLASCESVCSNSSDS